MSLSADVTLERARADALLARWDGRGPCRAVERLTGGMINAAFRLTFAGSPGTAVVKLNADADDAGLRSEAVRLRYLTEHTHLPVPAVHGFWPADDDVPCSCLLLSTIPGVNLTQVQLPPTDRERVETQLADALIDLHGHRRDTFGRVDGAGTPRWSDFFVPRLIDLYRRVVDDLPRPARADIDAALGLMPALLADQGEPTLAHQDLWAGNILVEERQDGWHLSGLVDPSGAKFADVEIELAYLQVFDTVGPAFFERYSAQRPLRAGYEARRLCYWLETWLNHLHLFGGEDYRRCATETAASLRRKSAGAV
jgi:fructosamine-3-kinase